jgi:hypothetical protein
MAQEQAEATVKPVGTYRCRACGRFSDGSELFDDPTKLVRTWTCSDITCGALVDKVSDEPYVRTP